MIFNFNMVIVVMAPFMIADLFTVLCQTISHELLNIYLIFCGGFLVKTILYLGSKKHETIIYKKNDLMESYKRLHIVREWLYIYHSMRWDDLLAWATYIPKLTLILWLKNREVNYYVAFKLALRSTNKYLFFMYLNTFTIVL